jgi:hypothetical protein
MAFQNCTLEDISLTLFKLFPIKKKQLEFQSLNSILAFYYWNEFLEYRLEIPFCCAIKWNFKPIFQKSIPIMEC